MLKKSFMFSLGYSRSSWSMLLVCFSLGFLKILKQFMAYVLSALDDIFVSELAFLQNSWFEFFFFLRRACKAYTQTDKCHCCFSPVCWGNWGLLPKTVLFKWLVRCWFLFWKSVFWSLFSAFIAVERETSGCGCRQWLVLFCPYALACACALLTVLVF